MPSRHDEVFVGSEAQEARRSFQSFPTSEIYFRSKNSEYVLFICELVYLTERLVKQQVSSIGSNQELTLDNLSGARL